MYGYIDGYDFGEMEAMKYFAPPASWSEEKKQDNVRTKVFSGDWAGSEKMDGYFSCLIKDEEGNIILKTRSRSVNGTFANKAEWVPQLNPFFDALPNGMCLLGELYLPSKPGSKNITSLLGCLKNKCIARQKDEKLHFYVFDCLANNGECWVNRAASERFESLVALSQQYEFEYVDWAEYVYGKTLWGMIQEILARGGEGMVITHKDAHYEPGKRSSKITLKIKQELKQTVDCVIMGANAPTKIYTGKDIENWQLWVNEATGERYNGSYYESYKNGQSIVPVTKTYYYGWAGSLKLGLYKGKELVHFGDLSGITDEMKEHWRDYLGQVVEVGGMAIFEDTQAIRHPRMISIRKEKGPRDCTWDQLEE